MSERATITRYVDDDHGYQLAVWSARLPGKWRWPVLLREVPDRLILLHWASPWGGNPTTEICVWNSHGDGKGAWMITSGRHGSELPRLDGGELFDGFKPEGRRRGMKGVRLLAWQPLPEPPVPHDE